MQDRDAYQAVQVMHPLHVHKVAASVFLGALDMRGCQAAAGTLLGGYDAGSVFTLSVILLLEQSSCSRRILTINS